jgi:precorrin-6B methylase 2
VLLQTPQIERDHFWEANFWALIGATPDRLKYSEEVKISEAITLIRTPLIEWTRQQFWCDLGSGSGTFTMALAHSLAPGSTIHAVDLDQRALDANTDRLPVTRSGLFV